jgi:endonuclease/exonuclease/phosphatase family metal-dependent hydrolase
MRLRVATWNLWWRLGDHERRRPAILAALRDLDADVIALQEVWSSATDDLASALATDLGMHAAFGASPDPTPWTRGHDGPAYGIGNAVLARWPVRAARTEGLPAGREPGTRVLHEAVVDTPAGSCPVWSVHLDSSLIGSAGRVEQVRTIARRVVTAAPADLPPLVAGDFNAQADSDEMRLLEGHLTAPAEPGLLLANTRRWAADPDEPTWTPANPYVVPSGSPPARIDHVLVGLDRGTVPVRVEHTAVFGDRPIDGVWPSDHFGVVVDLAVGRG